MHQISSLFCITILYIEKDCHYSNLYVDKLLKQNLTTKSDEAKNIRIWQIWFIYFYFGHNSGLCPKEAGSCWLLCAGIVSPSLSRLLATLRGFCVIRQILHKLILFIKDHKGIYSILMKFLLFHLVGSFYCRPHSRQCLWDCCPRCIRIKLLR